MPRVGKEVNPYTPRHCKGEKSREVMMAWVGKLNNIRNAAEEIIKSDIIYA